MGTLPPIIRALKLENATWQQIQKCAIYQIWLICHDPRAFISIRGQLRIEIIGKLPNFVFFFRDYHARKFNLDLDTLPPKNISSPLAN